jgi:hypothetical protein
MLMPGMISASERIVDPQFGQNLLTTSFPLSPFFV